MDATRDLTGISAGDFTGDFTGTKLALFIGQRMLVVLRDDFAHIPYPGYWDLPGGGREDGETPVDCTLRETEEEVGLRLAADDLVWSCRYPRGRSVAWFFAAHLPAAAESGIRLGSEGQRWDLWMPETYLSHPLSIPPFADQLRAYLHATASTARRCAS